MYRSCYAFSAEIFFYYCHGYVLSFSSVCSPFQGLECKFYGMERKFHSMEYKFQPLEQRNIRAKKRRFIPTDSV